MQMQSYPSWSTGRVEHQQEAPLLQRISKATTSEEALDIIRELMDGPLHRHVTKHGNRRWIEFLLRAGHDDNVHHPHDFDILSKWQSAILKLLALTVDDLTWFRLHIVGYVVLAEWQQKSFTIIQRTSPTALHDILQCVSRFPKAVIHLSIAAESASVMTHPHSYLVFLKYKQVCANRAASISVENTMSIPGMEAVVYDSQLITVMPSVPSSVVVAFNTILDEEGGIYTYVPRPLSWVMEKAFAVYPMYPDIQVVPNDNLSTMVNYQAYVQSCSLWGHVHFLERVKLVQDPRPEQRVCYPQSAVDVQLPNAWSHLASDMNK
jgi:hypothetical protein